MSSAETLQSNLTSNESVTNSPGSNYLASLYYLHDKGQASYASANELVSDIIGYGFISSLQSCKEAQITNQTVSISCDDAAKAALVRNSTNCNICRTGVRQIIDQRKQLENKAKQLNPEYQVQAPSQVLNEELLGTNAGKDAVDFDSICRYVCNQCVADNLSQVISAQMTNVCRSFGSNFKTSYVTGMFDRARQHVANNRESLQKLGYDLRSQAAADQFTIHMVSTISDMTSSKTYDTLFSQALLVQGMTIDSGSTSVVLQNASQSVTNTMLASIASKVFNDVAVKNAINFKDKVTKFDQAANFGSLVDAASKGITTVKKTVESSLGRILFAIVIVLAAVLLLVGLYIYRKRSQKATEISEDTYDAENT